MLRRSLALLLCGLLACLSMAPQAHEVASTPFTLFSRAGPIAMQLSLSPAQRLWIKGKGELVLGTSAPDYPPFDMTASGRDYEGLTADFAGLIGSALGLPIRVQRFATRQEAVRALAQGQIDLLGSTNGFEAVTPGIALSLPYAVDQPVMVTRENETRPLDTGLAGLRLSMVYHYLPMEEVLANYPDATIQSYPSYQNALNAVAFDQADVFLGDTISTHYLINQGHLQNVKMANFGKHEPVGFSFAVQRSNQLLLELINATLETVSSSTRESIFKRWSAGSDVLLTDRKLQLSQREERWLSGHPVVRVVVNETAAPLTFFDNAGNFRGIAADLLELIRLRTGLRFEVQRASGISDMIDRLNHDQADVIAAISPSPRRAGTLAISRPYLENSYVLLTRKGSDQPDSLEHMAGRRLALTRDSPLYDDLRQRFPGIQLVETESTFYSTSLLANGHVDAAITALINANFSLASQRELVIRSSVGAEPATFAMATARGAQELGSILDKALLSIAPEELGIINSRWRGYSTETDAYWQKYQRLILQVVLGTSLLLLLSLAWNAWMRRQIKQREAAERALNDQLEFMRALLNGTPHPMYVRDRAGLLQSCNVSYLEAVEARLEDVLGKSIRDSTLGDSCYASQIQADYQRVLREGVPLIVDRPLLLKERELTIYHWILPYRDSLGEVQGIIGGWIDISERRQLIQDLRLAKQRADDANRAKSVFLATISHEIRTPMNAIIGMLELTLKRADQGHIDRPAIEVAYNSAKELLTLIGDILDMARIESGHMTLAPESVNLAELVESVGRVFDGVARQKDLRLNLEIPAQARCEVLLDPLRFKQILSNLVSNGIKFTEQGQVTVHLALEPGPAAGQPTLLVTVQDSGIGIHAQDQQRLFLPFAQANPDSNLARSGTGLGLAISRDLCQAMGGTLSLHSVFGQGTRVSINMPLTLLADTPKPAPAPPAPDTLLPALHVLVIDDHPANLLLIAQQLDFLGLEHTSADNGLSGLSIWRQGRFDVVIVDCNMPQMNGYQFTQAMRDHEQAYQWLPCTVLGYTANAQPEVRERCRQVGMDDCLLKPISLNALGLRLAKAPLLASRQTVPMSIPFDLQGLEPLVGSNASDLRQLLEELRRSFQRDAAKLAAIDPSQDALQLMNLAHRILGPARIIQADELIQACERLEADCKDARALTVLGRRQRQVLSVMQALECALQAHLQQSAQQRRSIDNA
ncbi:transporter substrate-binding domain-containing protein [Pseudomonas rubra]|uniref:histidine kinase n=1 Tax=Pseudomonas rubra TaxID=2942627 RepID=A0ABT5PCN9_9PSED|nr:transporter substrate-binding domain-containing protein [Pseudomonas rubra]MDD1015985.1 transporter substrate-binding domain-containing protein [Pseudomonas rubra]MDD1039244.1 transporter substrate-binding domain-containing protein [Pseudomonas rubra]MDD1155214.1 transporter substrate-binding domain-containing protein [Pseudomonas rubra]